MDMRSFVGEEVVGGKTYVTVMAKETSDDTAYKTMVYSKPPFVPPVTLSEENGEKIFSYDVAADRFIRLNMCPNTITPVEFLTLMRNLTDALAKCEDYFMSPLNFLISDDLVYVRLQDYSIRMIYAPFQGNIFKPADIDNAVLRIAKSLVGQDGDWNAIGLRMFRLHDNTSFYEIGDVFAELYEQYSGPSRAQAAPAAPKYAPPVNNTPPINNTPPVNNTPPSYKPPQSAPAVQSAPVVQSAQYVPPTIYTSEAPVKQEPASQGLKFPWLAKKDSAKPAAKEKRTPAPKKGVFSDKSNAAAPGVFSGAGFSAPKQEEPPKPVYRQFNDRAASRAIDDDDVTMPVGLNRSADDDITRMPAGAAAKAGARLDRISGSAVLPPTIRVEPQNGVFVIGRVAKGKSNCDFAFASGTEGVSARHAQIKESGGRFFIVDINSSFGTYVDHHRIAPLKDIELIGGEVISFGTGEVDYEFHIEHAGW